MWWLNDVSCVNKSREKGMMWWKQTSSRTHFYCYIHKRDNSLTWHNENCKMTCWCNEPSCTITSFLSLNFALCVLPQQPSGLSLYNYFFPSNPALTQCRFVSVSLTQVSFILSSVLFIKIKTSTKSNWTFLPLEWKLQNGAQTMKETSKPTTKPCHARNIVEWVQKEVMSMFGEGAYATYIWKVG